MARKQIKEAANTEASPAKAVGEQERQENLQESADNLDKPQINPENQPQENIFNCQFDELERTLKFSLIGGKEIIMREPTTRIFLLAFNFINQHPEYVGDVFFLSAIANLSIISYGGDIRPSFDAMMDEIELGDLERLAAALGRFPDAMAKLAKWAADQQRKLPISQPK
jgi:hypothetical protein